jgi:hypothetical protein
MATKTIAWGTGSGNITLTYTGQGSGSVSVKSDANDLYEERVKSITIKTSKGSPTVTKTVTIKQKAKSLDWTTKNFEYTGGVQSIELPKGKYKLQCWGAQGGTSYGSSSGVGSKGGYSEGVLTLTETTTLYVFVGGKGSRGSSTSLVNGGWNGGGASVGYSSYSSGGEYGYSYPACGGGATDICTVTSSMSYSSGRTNRSSASLLSRIIVAGGGAGGSYRYTSKEVTTSNTTSNVIVNETVAVVKGYPLADDNCYSNSARVTINVVEGRQYSVVFTPSSDLNYYVKGFFGMPTATYHGAVGTFIGQSFTATENKQVQAVYLTIDPENEEPTVTVNIKVTESYSTSTTTTQTSSGYSNKSQQGGGTSGKGYNPGTQDYAGSGSAGFGYGESMTFDNYRYCSGGGGGGWYGGGANASDSGTSTINYSGGGSGFVNIAANSSYRPSGYTGLQLDSGTTTAGDTSHPSTSGGTETGHSGNGYAKITVL